MKTNIDEIRSYYDKPVAAKTHVSSDINSTATSRFAIWRPTFHGVPRGARVPRTAKTLSQNLIDQYRNRLSDMRVMANVISLAADARDLSSVPETDFDTVLLVEPLYHLTVRENRPKVLQESVAHLNSGGIFFSP